MEELLRKAEELGLQVSKENIFVYFSGNTNEKGYTPYIRVSNNDDGSFYVRNNGYIIENASLESVMDMFSDLN